MAVIAVAGCGSGGSPEPDTSSQASDETSTTTRSTAPSQAFGPTHTEGVIEKKFGEPAGLNCPRELGTAVRLELHSDGHCAGRAL
jgi:hypothetical protein